MWRVFTPGQKIEGEIWSGIGIAFLFKSKFFSTYLRERKLVLVNQEGQLVKEPERRQVSTQFSVFSSLHKISLKPLFRHWFHFKRRFIKRRNRAGWYQCEWICFALKEKKKKKNNPLESPNAFWKPGRSEAFLNSLINSLSKCFSSVKS